MLPGTEEDFSRGAEGLDRRSIRRYVLETQRVSNVSQVVAGSVRSVGGSISTTMLPVKQEAVPHVVDVPHVVETERFVAMPPVQTVPVRVVERPLVERIVEAPRFVVDEGMEKRLKAVENLVFSEERKLQGNSDTSSIVEQVMSNISLQFDDIFAKFEEHIDELYKRVTPEQILMHEHQIGGLNERMTTLEATSQQVKPNAIANMDKVAILQEEFRTGIREVRLMGEQMQEVPTKFEQIDKAILDLEQNQWPVKDMENLSLLSHRVRDLEEKDLHEIRLSREHIFEQKWSEAKMAELERKIAMKPDTVISQELVEQIYERLTELEQRFSAAEMTGSDEASTSARERSMLELQDYMNAELERLAKASVEECRRVESRVEVIDQRLQTQMSEIQSLGGLAEKAQPEVVKEYLPASEDSEIIAKLEKVETDQQALSREIETQLEGSRKQLHEMQRQFTITLEERCSEIVATAKQGSLEALESAGRTVNELDSNVKELMDSLKCQFEASCIENARAIIELHNKIARESASCYKAMTLQRDDVLQYITCKQVWSIQVKVGCAQDLRNHSYYCEVEIRNRTGVHRQTKVVKGSHPVWDEEFGLPDYVPGDSLLFSLYESSGSMLGKTVLVGKAVLSGEAIRQCGRFQGSLQLEELREVMEKTPCLIVEATERLGSALPDSGSASPIGKTFTRAWNSIS